MRTTSTILFLLLALTVQAARADQPHMERALRHLERAQAALESAKSNKGGHRARALDQVRKAEDEVRQGMAAKDDDTPKDTPKKKWEGGN